MKKIHILKPFKAVLVASTVVLVACGGGGAGGGGTDVAPGPVTAKVISGVLQTAGSRDGVGTEAQFNRPFDVAQDGAGNVYVADSGNNTIRKISPQGAVTTLAGTAGQAGSADGSGADARFSFPSGITVSETGTVFVSDTGNHTVRRITPQGVATTIAGAPGQAGNVDGPAAVARFTSPGKLAIDTDGTLYVAANYAIRRIAPDGTVSTFAGKSGEQSRTSGNAAQSRFVFPMSVAIGAGDIYVAESSDFASMPGGNIRKFNKQGDALSFGANADGVLPVDYPVDIAADASGVYVASNGLNQFGPRIFRRYRQILSITPDGRGMSTLAGTTVEGPILHSVDGPGVGARFVDPRGIAVGPGGRLTVAEASTHAIRAIDAQSSHGVTTLAGGNGSGYVDGPIASARFNEPKGLAAAPDGTLYIADFVNGVRKLSTSGVVSTLNAAFVDCQPGRFRPDGPVTGVEMIAASEDGTVYVLGLQLLNDRQVLAIDASGRARCFYTTGSEVKAMVSDAAGNLYLTESRQIGRNQVTMVSADGTARVLANFAALGLAVDAAGNVYFTSSNGTVGVIDAAARVTILAGLANQFGSVDATGEAARFSALGAIAVDLSGNAYVVDGLKIRKLSPRGEVSTLVDIASLDGLEAGPLRSSRVSGFVWSRGALYGIIQNALIQIAPVP